MKKYPAIAIIFTLLILLLLPSCGAERKEEKASASEFASGYETARECSIYSNLNRGGMLYMEACDELHGQSSRLRFIDFDTMQSAVICSKPNCRHNDSETCSAFGMHVLINRTNIFGDKLYFFDTVPEWSSGENGSAHILSYNLELWSAALDGTQRKKIDTFKGLDILDLVVKGNTVYFAAQERKETSIGNTYKTVGTPKVHLCTYDFDNGVFKNLGIICEGISAYAAIDGEYNGGLYISGSYREKELEIYNPDGSEKSIEELAKDKDYIPVRRRFDLAAEEFSDWDMPISTLNENDRVKPMFISGGFYGYMDGDNAHIIDSDGNEMVLENYELSASSASKPINGYYFNISGSKDGKSAYTAIDLKTGEILKINKKAVPKWHFVLTYHDGSYIIYDEISSGNFKKVSPDELFAKDEEK